MTQKILVYGANGSQAGLAAQALLDSGFQLRILTRNAAKATAWKDKGVEVVIGNMRDVDVLTRASEGCDAVFLLVPTVRGSNEEGVVFGVNAVKAAKAAGIQQLVWNTSGPIADEGSDEAKIDPGACVLRQLREAGISFLGLQPTLYMENFLGPWTTGRLAKEDVLAYPIPHDFKVQWVAARDFGVIAAAAFSAGKFPNEVIQLGGPEALDGKAAAATFSRVLDRDLTFETMAVEDFRAQLQPLVGPFIAGIVSGLYGAIQGAPDQLQPAFAMDMAPIARQYNIVLTPLERWIEQHKAVFKVASSKK